MSAARNNVVVLDGWGETLASGIGRPVRPWDGPTGIVHELPECFILVDEASCHGNAPWENVERIVGLQSGSQLSDSPRIMCELIGTLDTGGAVAFHASTAAQIDAAVQCLLPLIGGGHA